MRHWVKEVSATTRMPPLHYGCRLEKASPGVKASFQQSHYDEDTSVFFEQYCRTASVAKSLASPLLQTMMSRTDANAMLGRGQMHVITTAQVRSLLGSWADKPGGCPPRRMLDVGAGDGNVTEKLAPLVDDVLTTEVSTHMVRRLRSRGFRCSETTDLTPEGLLRGDNGVDMMDREGSTSAFDLVSCCNVLDRCSSPWDLLQQMRDLLRRPGQRTLHANK